MVVSHVRVMAVRELHRRYETEISNSHTCQYALAVFWTKTAFGGMPLLKMFHVLTTPTSDCFSWTHIGGAQRLVSGEHLVLECYPDVRYRIRIHLSHYGWREVLSPARFTKSEHMIKSMKFEYITNERHSSFTTCTSFGSAVYIRYKLYEVERTICWWWLRDSSRLCFWRMYADW